MQKIIKSLGVLFLATQFAGARLAPTVFWNSSLETKHVKGLGIIRLFNSKNGPEFLKFQQDFGATELTPAGEVKRVDLIAYPKEDVTLSVDESFKSEKFKFVRIGDKDMWIKTAAYVQEDQRGVAVLCVNRKEGTNNFEYELPLRATVTIGSQDERFLANQWFGVEVYQAYKVERTGKASNK